LRVRSTDLDRCVPEGSRQMHFNVSVLDYQERNRGSSAKVTLYL